MELVIEPMVYRPRRDRGLMVIVCSAPFAVLGLAILCAVGVRAVVWAAGVGAGGLGLKVVALGLLGLIVGALGLLGLIVGVARLRTRVRVDAHGLAKTPWITGGFTIRWDEVESWSVAPVGIDDHGGDSCTFWLARFRVRNRRWEVTVADSEVSRPGFEPFLQQLRQHVGERERAEPPRCT